MSRRLGRRTVFCRALVLNDVGLNVVRRRWILMLPQPIHRRCPRQISADEEMKRPCGQIARKQLSDLPSILFSYQPVAGQEERLRIMRSKVPCSPLPEYTRPTYSAFYSTRH